MLDQSRRYNEVTFIGTHNSYCNNSPGGEYDVRYSKLVLNQQMSIREQFEAGIRVFDIEVQKCPLFNDFIVCHGTPYASFFLGKSSLFKLFSEIKKLADEFPREIITVFVNPVDNVYHEKWYNSKIKEICKESGLHDSVFSYNEHRQSQDQWPKLEDMVHFDKNVMFLGLVGHINFKKYSNEFTNKNGKKRKAWKAESLGDLSPGKLVIDLKDGNMLFFLDCKYFDGKFPYVWGGNPECAKEANKTATALTLAQKANEILSEKNQRVFCIRYDFVNMKWNEVVETVNRLNQS